MFRWQSRRKYLISKPVFFGKSVFSLLILLRKSSISDPFKWKFEYDTIYTNTKQYIKNELKIKTHLKM